MASTAHVGVDRSFAVVDAIHDMGGGRYQSKDIRTRLGIGDVLVAQMLMTAADQGWVVRTGKPRTTSARWGLTASGQAEWKRRHETRVELGSAPEPDAPIEVDAGTPAESDRPSLRERVIQVVCDNKMLGIVGLAHEVRSLEGGRWREPFGFPELNAIVKSLSRDGLVTYREGAENGHHALTDIRATSRLLKDRHVDTASREVGHHGTGPRREAPLRAGDRTDFRTHGFRAEGGPIEIGTVEVMAAEPAFPILDSLIEREQMMADERRHAEALVEAAALLEALDPDEAKRLEARAEQIASAARLEPVEDEYIRFARRTGLRYAGQV